MAYIIVPIGILRKVGRYQPTEWLKASGRCLKARVIGGGIRVQRADKMEQDLNLRLLRPEGSLARALICDTVSM